jgi:ubiquitin-protein ligase
VIESVDSSDNTVTFQNKKGSKFTLTIKKKQDVLHIMPTNKQDIPSVHLAGLLMDRKYTDPNQVPELINFVTENLNTITNYCVGCYKKMGHQSDIYINCGNDECVYKFEELRFGDPVIESFKRDPEIFMFLIRSSFDAITCDRKLDIFEPFPSKFIKGDVNMKRGEITKMVGKNYDAYKDFDRLNKIISTLNLDKFSEELDMFIKDKDILDAFGEDTYSLIRFIIMSCKIEIVLDTSMKDIPNECKIYRITHPMDKDTEFEQLKKTAGKTHYLFHGSRWHNWYSIMRNGLKNCSGGKLQTSGAAHGSGIYASDDAVLSYSYGVGTNAQRGVGTSVIGIFEILGDKSTYKKTKNIYVIDDDKVLIQRYLITVASNKGTVLSRLNTVFNAEIYEEKARTTAVVTTKGIKKLVKEYKVIARTIKKNPDSLGFRVTVDPNNAFVWKVFLDKYDEEYPVGKDMKKLGIKDIEMELLFPESYPFNPPFVRVIKPRFKHLTGNISRFGAVCNMILSPKFWSPACSIETLLITIKSQVIEGDGRIDPVNYNTPYGLKEAEDSFINIMRGHGWL